MCVYVQLAPKAVVVTRGGTWSCAKCGEMWIDRVRLVDCCQSPPIQILYCGGDEEALHKFKLKAAQGHGLFRRRRSINLPGVRPGRGPGFVQGSSGLRCSYEYPYRTRGVRTCSRPEYTTSSSD